MEQKTPELRNPQSAIRNERGFTLIEVLISVAIVAGMVTVIYASFSTASRNVEQAEARRDSTDLARTLTDRLSNDIANAFCAPLVAGKTRFYGKKQEQDAPAGKQRLDSLYLTTLTNWRRAGTKETDLWEVGYFFKEKSDGSGQVLLRQERRDLGDENATPAEYELTDRITDLQFVYYTAGGAVSAGDFGSNDKCTRTNDLPLAVGISLTLADGSQYATRTDIRIAQGQ